MGKHVRQELIRLKIARINIVQRQIISSRWHYHLDNVDHNINNDKISNYRCEIKHAFLYNQLK